MAGGDTKQRINDLEAELAIARQRVTDLANENRHLRECHPTIRDHFAMAAMRALIRNTKQPFDPNTLSDGAYCIADAMMEAKIGK